jgi:ABC-type cobalamin/Fe3+-siderophores transport system ATPase subunit
LLSLVGVDKRFSSPERVVLREATLHVSPGELAVVWGLRRCGRTTLLRIAAGMEAPDAGVVRFQGRDLARHGERILGVELAYVQKTLRAAPGQSVLEEATVGLLARGFDAVTARAAASCALERAGVGSLAAMPVGELDAGESIRFALARTLALKPRLIVIDEPVKGVELIDRDPILLLLRSLAEEGVAVLASASEATGLTGADQVLTLSRGELRGTRTEDLAPVVPLRRAGGLRAGG